jgi:Tol biopolymer transport system component
LYLYRFLKKEEVIVKSSHLFVTLILSALVSCDKSPTESKEQPENSSPTSNLSGKIAYVDRSIDKKYSINVVDENGKNKSVLIGSSNTDLGEFKFAPDGKKLFYSEIGSSQGTETRDYYLLSLTEGTKYPFDYFSIAWSPDSKTIACVKPLGIASQLSLVIMENTFKNQKSLVSPVARDFSYGHGKNATAWSPDGNYLAYMTLTRLEPDWPIRYRTDLFTINKDGTKEQIFIPNISEEGHEALGVGWNLDGSIIYVVLDYIYLFNTNTKELISSIKYHSSVSFDQKGPFWVDNSRFMCSDRLGIYLFNINGTKEVTFVNKNNWQDWQVIISSNQCLSPDRTKLVYSDYSDDYMEIFICDISGSNKKQITSDYSTNLYPCWIP